MGKGCRGGEEGRAGVVVSIPTSAELRKEFETGFQKTFPGIELELSVARGASNINKIAEEQNAGVQRIDLHIGGTTSIITGLLAQNLLEPMMPSMLLPEVSDPKHWWGGHIWADNAKKFIYSFTAYMTETVWYNSTLVRPEEISSWDSLLDPKWKGKIAILDPRSPGSGESTWAFLLKIKGEQFLAKLAAQEMIGRAQSSSIGRGGGAGQVGDLHRPIVLHLPAVYQSRTAGKPLSTYQRRLLRRHRQRQSRDARRTRPSQRYESICQLVAVQGRTDCLTKALGSRRAVSTSIPSGRGSSATSLPRKF